MRFMGLFTRLVRQPICSVRDWMGAPMATTTRDSGIRLRYEREYDHLSVWVGAPTVADNVEVEPGVCVRVSRADRSVVGLEVIDAGHRFHKDQATLENPAYARTLLQQYGPRAIAPFRPSLAGR